MKTTKASKPAQAPVGERPSALDRLTDKQKVFVVEYMKDLNASRAARAAGYSAASAGAIGSENLRKPDIAAAVSEQLKTCGVSPERICLRLASIVFGRDLADFEAYLTGRKSLVELRQEGVDTSMVRKAVSRTTRQAGGMERTRRELELLDPLAAVRELNRVLGIVSEKRSVDIGGSLDLSGLSDEELRRLAHAIGEEGT